jgi:hypothetical protein
LGRKRKVQVEVPGAVQEVMSSSSDRFYIPRSKMAVISLSSCIWKMFKSENPAFLSTGIEEKPSGTLQQD